MVLRRIVLLLITLSLLTPVLECPAKTLYGKGSLKNNQVELFTTSWCPYCHAVMPFLQQIQEDYAEFGVKIYAINFHDDSNPVEYMNELGWDFMVFPLGDLVADDYGVISSPGVSFCADRPSICLASGDSSICFCERENTPPPLLISLSL